MADRHSESEKMPIDTNILDAVTSEFRALPGTTTMSFFCVGTSGGHGAHVITPQMSPDGTNWFDATTATLSASRTMIMSHECNCVLIRFKVTTVEGSPSTCDLYIFAN